MLLPLCLCGVKIGLVATFGLVVTWGLVATTLGFVAVVGFMANCDGLAVVGMDDSSARCASCRDCLRGAGDAVASAGSAGCASLGINASGGVKLTPCRIFFNFDVSSAAALSARLLTAADAGLDKDGNGTRRPIDFTVSVSAV